MSTTNAPENMFTCCRCQQAGPLFGGYIQLLRRPLGPVPGTFLQPFWWCSKECLGDEVAEECTPELYYQTKCFTRAIPEPAEILEARERYEKSPEGLLEKINALETRVALLEAWRRYKT